MKTTIEIDSDLLVQFNRISDILGISPAKYVESYLKALPADLGLDPVLHVANELFYESYRSPELAQAAAERLEAYAVEQKLEGNAAAGVISAEAVQYQTGFWRVKVSHLTWGSWHLIASDLWGEDDDEGEEWKQQS
jgi:hypothetical protein